MLIVLRLRNSGVRDQRGTKAYKDSSPPKALGPGGHDNKARGMLCARQGEHYKNKARDPGQKRLLVQLMAELVLQGHTWSSGKSCVSWEKL